MNDVFKILGKKEDEGTKITRKALERSLKDP